MENSDEQISGIFVNILRLPFRVVIRHQISHFHDRYDVHKPWEKIDAVILVIRTLLEEVPDFTAKILEVDEEYYQSSPHRTRHYIHTEKDMLYGKHRKDLAESYSRRIGRDLWLGTNISTSQMRQVILEACEAAEIDHGVLRDVKW